MPLEEALATISGLAERGGPHRHEYQLFWQACDGFRLAKSGGHISDDEHRSFMASLGPAGTSESLMGHIFNKPFGYAGDFEIIDRLYTCHISANPMVTRWDEFVQAVPSSQSVRNRAPYLRQVVLKMLADRNAGEPLHIVSLGSGPGRDIECALDAVAAQRSRRGQEVRVTCIDLDARALACSERILARHNRCVRYVNADVLRLRLDEPVNLIWSSGLFDYFSDRAFAVVFSRLMRAVAPGGQIVVGNFSKRCSENGPMAFVNWHLVVRDADELRALAARGGALKASIDAEPVGLNLFLHAEHHG